MSNRALISLIVVILAVVHLIPVAADDWQTASWTRYTSYAACCHESHNYDPNADTSECDDYSACEYLGEFAAIGHQSFEYVKSNDIIAFYDDNDYSGSNFDSRYGSKKIRLRANGVEFEAVIADTCGNDDCNGCCHENSNGGFLVDMEYWTVMRNFGTTDVVDAGDGTIEFQIIY